MQMSDWLHASDTYPKKSGLQHMQDKKSWDSPNTILGIMARKISAHVRN
jgi:hypothetical protein